MRTATSPLVAVARGFAAGAVGTAVMTGYQLAVAKVRGSESSGAPAEVGRRIIEGVLQREVPPDRMEGLNNAMHVLYGTSWGPVYGIVQASLGRPPIHHGALFGVVVWTASLIELPAMKIAPPVWETPPLEVALDLSYHLVYGIGVAGAFALLDR
ncbi:MAG: DUF6789 family protein [Solirubrobacteraceae bacterium]